MKPIIFSAPMVRRILDGKKTQTRRVLHEANFAPRGMPPLWAEAVHPARNSGYIAWERGIINDLATFTKEQYATGFMPRYQVGDRLWVREALRQTTAVNLACYAEDNTAVYRDGHWATWEWNPTRKTLPAMFMPQWATRLNLCVDAVRPERLLDITEADAQAEGFDDRAEFLAFWGKLYAKKPQLQAAKNPWVWVYGFRQI